MASKEQDNLLRWDGKERGWYEVYFLKFNDLESRTAGWLRYTLTSPLPHLGSPYCELWGIFFDAADPAKNFAVKERFPIERLARNDDPFTVHIGAGSISQVACRGEIQDGARGHALLWDLRFDSGTGTFYHYPLDWMYRAPLPRTKLLSPHLDARFSGRLVADGRTIDLENAPGQQSHMWGTQHGLRWAWGHCNAFRDSPGTVWEGLDAQVAIGPFTSPHLKLFFLRHEGKDYRFNDPLQLLLNHSCWTLGCWSFEARNRDLKIVGEARSDLAEFVGVTYTDPDGTLLWCNNSKVATLRIRLYDGSDRLLEEIVSDQAAAAEYVDRKAYPGVRIHL